MLAGVAGSFGAVVIAAVFYLLRPIIANWKLRQIMMRLPGPPVRSLLLGNILDMPSDRHERPYANLAFAIKYGKNGAMRFFLGPVPLLSIVGPQMAREIFSSSKHGRKNFFYRGLHSWIGLGLLTSNGEKWKMMRRLTTPAFHFEVLVRFLDVMNEQSEVMLERMASHEGKGSFDVSELITACALDIICETAMGRKINAQAVEGHTPYVDAVYEMSRIVVRRMDKPWLESDLLFSLTADGRTAKRCLRILHDFTNQVIAERKKVFLSEDREDAAGERGQRPAFLDILLEAQARGEPITDANIREEVDTFMFEGHDTTSASMSWTLQLLGSHPEIQERLHQELVEVMGDSRDLTYEMLGQLKYLDMVLKESLRLYPSVPVIGRELTEDVVIDGVTIPQGTNVSVSVFSLHHRPDYWPDPEKFDPERWTPENSQDRDPYVYVPFSAGSRNCIGQKFAQNEEKVLIGKIIRRFKIVAENKHPRVLPELVLRPVNGVPITLTARN